MNFDHGFFGYLVFFFWERGGGCELVWGVVWGGLLVVDVVVVVVGAGAAVGGGVVFVPFLRFFFLALGHGPQIAAES